MPDVVDWVPETVWIDIVKYVPIPSVDLLVFAHGGVLLAKRKNSPAKGEWFVPGGRVHKGETLEEAVHRVGREELGVKIEIEQELGSYNHLYEDSDVPDSDGKHYVANGYVVTPITDNFELDEQHAAWNIFHLNDFPDVHPYVEMYLQDSELRANS